MNLDNMSNDWIENLDVASAWPRFTLVKGDAYEMDFRLDVMKAIDVQYPEMF